jgi:hypothetical protein
MKTRLLLAALFTSITAIGLAVDEGKGCTVHEWGTFTCVQGADGKQMIWNPFVAPELPKFVYDRNRAQKARIPGITVAGKTGTAQRQRMETPVIYFYSDRPQTLDVAVRFPQGTVSEWFPQKTAIQTPSLASGPNAPVLHWPRVDVLAGDASAQASLPTDPSGSHYFAARETDASVLRVWDGSQTSELEKFLFYRGVAGFEAPLTVRLGSSDSQQVSLANTGSEDLRNLLVYEVRADGTVSWQALDALAAGVTSVVDLGRPTGAGVESLAATLRKALVGQGLYEKEAAAMVKTWESSWFSERGRRVLYILPRAWTDRTLPLSVLPAPKTVERVMVARAEIITPQMEAALLHEVEQYIAAKPEERPKIVAETRALGMGRFTGCVLSRLFLGTKRSDVFGALSWELVQAAGKPALQTAAAN